MTKKTSTPILYRTKAGKPVYDAVKAMQSHPKHRELASEAKTRVELGSMLQSARTAQGLSMVDLAKKAGTTPAVICRIENAEVSAGIDLVARLFQALGKREVRLRVG